MNYRLYGVPSPLSAESTNSWLQRIAHRYDLSFSDLQDAFGVKWESDADLKVTREAYGAIARVCGRPVSETNLMYSIFCLGQGAEVALADRDGLPIYRFCVACFQDDAIPYLRIEWRLWPWTVCPKHLCRLRSSCGGCGRDWRMEGAVLRERRSKARSLAHCRWCGLDQRRLARSAPSAQLITEAERGRAVISALANRYAEIVRGLSRTRVSVSFLLANLDRLTPRSVAVRQEYVSLVIDRTATIGIERRLALARSGVNADLPGRLRVSFDRYHLAAIVDGRVQEATPWSLESYAECLSAGAAGIEQPRH